MSSRYRSFMKQKMLKKDMQDTVVAGARLNRSFRVIANLMKLQISDQAVKGWLGWDRWVSLPRTDAKQHTGAC